MVNFLKCNNLYVLNHNISFFSKRKGTYGINTDFYNTGNEYDYIKIEKIKYSSCKNIMNVFFKSIWLGTETNTYSINFYNEKKIKIPTKNLSIYQSGTYYTLMYKMKDISNIFYLATDDTFKMNQRIEKFMIDKNETLRALQEDFQNTLFVNKKISQDRILYEKNIDNL